MDQEKPTDEKRLIESLRKLTKEIERYNSSWRNLGKGVLFGIGSAIGASIIAAIIIGTLAKIIHSLKDIPGIFR